MPTKKSKTKTTKTVKASSKPVVSSNSLTIIVVGVILIGIVVGYNQYLVRKNAEYQAAINAVDQKTITNFVQIGTLAKNSAGLKKDTWYLNYNETGLSAVNVELAFDKETVCQGQTKDKPCDPSKLKVGQNVKITGNINGSRVTVSALTNLTASTLTKTK